MLGEQVGLQERLFYEFDLEDRVPCDHLLRRIDAVLDLSWLRTELSPFYSHTGRPSVDPELMIRMLLVGYCYSIRSDRRLCQEVELNLAYRWFCRLGLEDAVPDHSTFSVNRHGRFRDSDILRSVFESIDHALRTVSVMMHNPPTSWFPPVNICNPDFNSDRLAGKRKLPTFYAQLICSVPLDLNELIIQMNITIRRKLSDLLP
jgi:transposase